MGISKEQAVDNKNNEFHYGECKVTVGPRGGIKGSITRYRRTGQTTIWRTRPLEFRVPIKHGMRNSGNWYLTEGNASEFHLPEACPLTLKCQHCGSTGPDVHERPDLYDEDLNNHPGAKHVSCTSCDDKLTEDL